MSNTREHISSCTWDPEKQNENKVVAWLVANASLSVKELCDIVVQIKWMLISLGPSKMSVKLINNRWTLELAPWSMTDQARERRYPWQPTSESMQFFISLILAKGGRRGKKNWIIRQTKMALLEGQETRANANTNDKLSPTEGSKVAPEPLEGRPLVEIGSRLPLPT